MSQNLDLNVQEHEGAAAQEMHNKHVQYVSDRQDEVTMSRGGKYLSTF